MKFHRMLIFLVIVFGCWIPLQSQNVPIPDSVRYAIENCIRPFDPAKVETTNAGYQFWFADSNFAQGKTVKLSVVGPGSAKHPPHVHAEDEFYFILEGTAELFLNGRTGTAGPMTCFYCPSNVKHGIRNAGDVGLKYLVIKKYNLTQ